MSGYVFEVIDKTNRKIRLTNKQWKHIKREHPEIKNEEIIKDTLKHPITINQPYEGKKHYYYSYYKNRKSPDKYLIVIVNYLNGKSFIITAFYTKYIK